MRSRAADTERVIPQFWEGIGHQTEAILRQLTAQGSENMPDIVAHNAHGKQVLSHLKPDIVSLIDREMFQSGLMGPDPFIFYRFFAPHFRHGINKRGKLMHTSGADEFLLALAKQSKKELFETKDIRCFSFMCGFLCHFSLDSIVHPYIELLEAGNKGMHTAIEHRIDMMILERDGKQPRDILGLITQYIITCDPLLQSTEGGLLLKQYRTNRHRVVALLALITLVISITLGANADNAVSSATKNKVTVMDSLGHTDPTSVMKYLLFDESRIQECSLSLEEAGISMGGALA